MLISGHKDARIFERYNIVDTRDVAGAMRKLSEYEARKRADRLARLKAEAVTNGPSRLLGSLGFTEDEKGTESQLSDISIH